MATDTYPAPTNIHVYFSNAHSPCQSRARIVFTDLRRSYYTSYKYASGVTTNALAVLDKYRCYTEFGVRRSDGSYFTKLQVNNTHHGLMPPGCPY